MTSRQRVQVTLDHRAPNRVPWDYWASPELTRRLLRDLNLPDEEALLRHFDVDLRYIPGPSFVGQEFARYPDGSVEDLWGVPRKEVRVQIKGGEWTYKHVAESPLASARSPADIDAYPHWPSSDWWDYSGLAAEAGRYPDHCVVYAGDRLDRTAQLKPMMYLRGMAQTYEDLAAKPEIVDAILAHINGYFLEYNRRVFSAAGDRLGLFMMGDDFGTQDGLMMSVPMWRRYFREGFRKSIELAHTFGLKVMHHTCGSVVELIPDFIECGLDVLQSLQPRARGMDLAALKREYGRDLCFHGSIDIQETMPRGTPEEVREEARRRLAEGMPGGGFIVSTAHNMQPDVPTENVVALFEAYREFGGY